MGHKSKFSKQLSFVSQKTERIQAQSKRTPLIQKEGEFYRVLSFQSVWKTEEVEA